MPLLKFTEVLTYSSEDPNHPVENLLKPDTYLKWKSKPGHNEKQECVSLKIETLSKIRSVDIGNEGSAFVEVLVSRGDMDFQVLLVASSFMTPLESRNGTTTNRVRMFGQDKLNKNIADQKWDRIKVICTQPFNRSIQYGLTFIKVHGPESESEKPSETKLGRFTIRDDNEDEKDLPVGSLFAKRNEKPSPLTGAAAIRAASKLAASPEVGQPKKRDSEESENAPTVGYYQLKKKAKAECPPSKVKQSPPSKVRESPKPRAPPPKDQLSKPKAQPDTRSPQPKQATPSTKPEKPGKNDEATKKKRKSRPFSQLMSDVVFVMSGYQNPQRSQLRDKFADMGAQYKSDWGPGCTHLICAFKNTPKFQAVKGKGKIVSEKWIDDSFKKKIRIPWRRYNLEKNRNSDESEEEVWATEICPATESNEQKATVSSQMSTESCDVNSKDDSEDTDDEIEKALEDNKNVPKPKEASEKPQASEMTNNSIPSEDDVYDIDTDVDEEPIVEKEDTTSLSLPPLNGFLKGKTFFLYGSIANNKRKELTRYIVAFKGQVSNYMNEGVNYVLTEDAWDDYFDAALGENQSLQFVKPQWIWKCCDKEKFVPPQPFLVVPVDED